jgi:hypothetical protein
MPMKIIKKTRKKQAPKEQAPFVICSFRMAKSTKETIVAMAENKGITQSEVLREAVVLLNRAANFPKGIELASVDTKDHKGPEHYRVRSWILTGV